MKRMHADRSHVLLLIALATMLALFALLIPSHTHGG